MPEPTKIPRPFADSGDKNSIPDSSGALGFASWQEGFPAITSEPFSSGGVAPKRADFNGIFYALSQAVIWMQQGGVYAYDSNTDYEAGNVVLDAGGLYVANSANGPSSSVVQPSSDTTGATWKPVRLNLATQSVAGYMSAADKITVDSIQGLGTFNKMFFSQTSGTYVAPRTGVYRVTIKGGGGGGGGGAVSSYYTGASGGEGATLVFYDTLTKNQAYPFVIGAGGTAGTNDNSSPAGGGAGGASSFNSQYSVNGGGGGNAALNSGLRGGGGGESYSAPGSSTVFFIPGAGGQPGIRTAGSTWLSGQTIGGGAGGSQNNTAIYGGGGGGGGGAGSAKNPGAGGNGFILIEYAG